MATYLGVDHIAFETNDMEATVRFYHDVLGMKLVRTLRTGGDNDRRHYFFDAGHGNYFAFFDGATLPASSPQLLNHLSVNVDTAREFDEAYQKSRPMAGSAPTSSNAPTAGPSISRTPTASGCSWSCRPYRMLGTWKETLTRCPRSTASRQTGSSLVAVGPGGPFAGNAILGLVCADSVGRLSRDYLGHTPKGPAMVSTANPGRRDCWVGGLDLAEAGIQCEHSR